MGREGAKRTDQPVGTDPAEQARNGQAGNGQETGGNDRPAEEAGREMQGNETSTNESAWWGLPAAAKRRGWDSAWTTPLSWAGGCW